MIPIGIVTRNRHRYLDVMLRSLSATELPDDQEVIIYDDGSDDIDTLKYLNTSECVALDFAWPDLPWVRDIQSRKSGPGIAKKLKVIRLGNNLGVVHSSCRAISLMVERYGRERGIIMCQDDIIFERGWHARLTAPIQSNEQPVGLVGGMWLNHNLRHQATPHHIARGSITAQCYYFTPAGLRAIAPFLGSPPADKAGFDCKICRACRQGDAHVFALSPGMGQHIGIVSSVRPARHWRDRDRRGRIDHSVVGPFVIASTVKEFKPHVNIR